MLTKIANVISHFLQELPAKAKLRKIVKTSLDDLRRGKPTSLAALALLALQPTAQQLKTLDKQFLEERFWNDLPVVEFAEQYNIDRRRAYESLNQAIAALSDRLLISKCSSCC